MLVVSWKFFLCSLLMVLVSVCFSKADPGEDCVCSKEEVIVWDYDLDFCSLLNLAGRDGIQFLKDK